LRKSLILLAGLAVAVGGTAQAGQTTTEQGVSVPELGVEHVYRCEDTDGWEREATRRFTMIDDEHLRVEMRDGDRQYWVEKAAADLGNWTYDTLDFGNVVWRSEYDIENLDEVRRLVPGAHAKGHIDYSTDTAWKRDAISVEIFPPSVIEHTTLGETEVIRIESRRWDREVLNARWVGDKWVREYEPSDVRTMTAYVDTATHRILRYVYADPKSTTTCDWTGTR